MNNKIRIFLLILIPVLILAAFLLSVFNYYGKENGSLRLINTELDFELSPMDFVGNCISEAMMSSVEVYVVEDAGENIAGRFYSKQSAIVLVITDLSVVAHEVSHFVDFVVNQKGINDTETRAYLQGYFTNCVYKLT